MLGRKGTYGQECDHGDMSPMNLSRELATIEDYTTLAPQVRAYLTGRLQMALEAMEPYVDGTFEVSPGMMTVFLRACRELGLLYRVYDRPAAKADEGVEVEPQLALEQVRQEVLDSLEELSQRLPG